MKTPSVNLPVSQRGSSISAGTCLNTLLYAPFSVAWFDRFGIMQECNNAFQVKAKIDSRDGDAIAVYQLFPTMDPARWSRLLQDLTEEPYIQTNELLASGTNAEIPVGITLQFFDGDKKNEWVAMYIGSTRDDQLSVGIQMLQHEVLEAVAVGCSLNILMEMICSRVEVLAPDVICTVLLVDGDGRVHPCAAPSMPKGFSEAIEGEPIGPCAGSCGTAAWRGEPVEVTDIANDPLWEIYRELALSFGLRACWSNPVFTRDGRVVGTFALYYREARGTSDFHRHLVQSCVHLCSLAIEHEESERQIYELAFHDPLTGLANRMLLRDRARLALNQVEQGSTSLAVLFMDLDRFKTVNDSLGHSMGDQLLKAIAERLQGALTSSDTIARLGGDEFIILLMNANAARARRVVERLLKSITEPLKINGVEISATASVGISMAPDDNTDFENLLKNADVAMYKAKTVGRNSYQFFQKHMNEQVVDRVAKEMALRKAITENELVVYYQPQIDIQANCIYGFEALVRWQHPELGLISPCEFITLAEEIGLIGNIDQWVIEQACEQCAKWRAEGVEIKHISVNLSAMDFLDNDMLSTIRLALERYQLPPSCLTLEITEGLMLNSVPDTINLMQSISEFGLGLSVDDFGTGYSSLSYIKQFPIHELKVDQSFIRDIVEDEGDRALSHAIVQMGRILKLVVVAEGVETAEQLCIVREQGFPVVQGYYFCKPLPARDVLPWLSARQESLPGINSLQ